MWFQEFQILILCLFCRFKFIESDPARLMLKSTTITTTTDDNYSLFLLRVDFNVSNKCNETSRHQQNMFRPDRIAFLDKSSSSSSSQKHSTKWEICRWLIRAHAHYCLRPENVRIDCMSQFTEKENCVDVEWNEWQSVASSGNGDGDIPTDERYIAKVILNWSLFNFVEFVGFLCTLSLVPFPFVWLATHSISHELCGNTRIASPTLANVWMWALPRDNRNLYAILEIFLALISRDRDLGEGREERERERERPKRG